MKRSLCTLAVGAFSGSVVTLALVLWLQRGVLHAVADGEGTPSGNGDVNADGTIDVSDVIYTCRWLFLDGEAPQPIVCPPTRLPATGQTKCYNASDPAIELPCDSANFPGQDGLYQAGCPTDGRFVDHGDGTVTDACTGLMWQKDTAPGTYNWPGALRYCDALELAGHSDWRLPNVRELQSLADYGRFGPAIHPAFGSKPEYHWSSTPGAYNYGTDAWIMSGYYGDVNGGDKTKFYCVRAVRGGL